MKNLKILFCGLGNAGKTSILKVLENDIESIPDLPPTIEVEYTPLKILGLNLVIWDMGGQVAYRQKYLLEYELFFDNSNVLFFVLDILAEDSIQDSLDYLKEIVKILKKLALKDIFVSVLFHKSDPVLPWTKEEFHHKVVAIRAKVNKILGEIPHVVYLTTIYEPHTVFIAFSDGIMRQVTEAEILQKKVEETARDFDSQAVILLSSGGYIYGSWHSKDVQLEELAKFSRMVQDYARLLSEGTYADYVSIPMEDDKEISAVYFRFKDEYVACCALIQKSQQIIDVQSVFLTKKEDLQKIFQKIFQVLE